MARGIGKHRRGSAAGEATGKTGDQQKRQAKKTGAIRPRSNNDKRRMVTRRHRQPRTVNTDTAKSQEFEKFFVSSAAIFLRLLLHSLRARSAGPTTIIPLFRPVAGARYCACCAVARR
ncbi:hypothetical protein FNZ07_18765 [Paraburkholderia megapolitana]|nr:hypothetical protein FNZ07_18765 [Paraburkholderia megapolitana]